MSDLDRLVAGIRCRDVLAGLNAYVDGELPAADVERVEGHLRGCDRCERFGGEFSAIIRALRESLAGAAALDASVEGRLLSRLDREFGESG